MVADAAYVAGGVLLGIWFALSLIANLLPRSSRIRRIPFSWALPEWRFFAPTPATHDYEVFFRSRSPEGRPGEPNFVTFPRRKWNRGLLNPHSRTRKATRDAIDDLLSAAAGTAREGGPNDVTPESTQSASVSAGYGAVLREVRRLARDGPRAEHVQFGVLFLQGNEPPRIVFVSRWHTTR